MHQNEKQWNKKKHSTSTQPNQESLKRSGKSGSGKSDSSKRSSGDEREKRRPERDKDRNEKLIKLRSIVSEQKPKEIEVKTSDGVMKFE
uniref:Uncharacterized protein n=1 Tax=Megaselia scalaris TaxID=36166 RepID=T1GIK1_MEGSC